MIFIKRFAACLAVKSCELIETLRYPEIGVRVRVRVTRTRKMFICVDNLIKIPKELTRVDW